MQVAEFVPQIALAQCLRVGEPQVLEAGQCLKHRQVRRTRLVQASQQPIDRPNTTSRRYDKPRPALSGV